MAAVVAAHDGNPARHRLDYVHGQPFAQARRKRDVARHRQQVNVMAVAEELHGVAQPLPFNEFAHVRERLLSDEQDLQGGNRPPQSRHGSCEHDLILVPVELGDDRDDEVRFGISKLRPQHVLLFRRAGAKPCEVHAHAVDFKYLRMISLHARSPPRLSSRSRRYSARAIFPSGSTAASSGAARPCRNGIRAQYR